MSAHCIIKLHVRRFSAFFVIMKLVYSRVNINIQIFILYSIVAPQPFQSELEVSLTFQRDGSPIVDVTFEVNC